MAEITRLGEQDFSMADMMILNVLLIETVLAFCLGKTLPVSKLGCVLSQGLVAFCLEDFLRFVSRPAAFCLKTWLRFVSRPPAFCLKTYCVLSQDFVAFCLNTWLRFVSRPPAFCLETYCVLSQDYIQCAGSDTRPPMLDRTDFASWQQRIRLYCRGKENRVNILKSIDEGPYQMGTVREPLAEGTERAPHLGPERPRVYSDMSPKEKDRYNANIQATNILIQRLPKDIYTLINHYTDAKDIEHFRITKEDRELQLYDDFEHFRQHNGETIHDYYVRFAKLINDMRNIKMTMSRMRLNSKAHSKELHTTEASIELRILQRQDVADAGSRERGNFGRRADIADDCDAFDSDVDEAPTAQTMFMANMSSADPVTDEAGPLYDSDILSEVQDHDHYQDAVCAHHEEHAMHDNVQLNHDVDSHADHTSDSNMIPYDQYVKDNAVPVVQSNVSSV
nr:retrovirus-related Pol polyprotein from transposon TNT 1-94 [Tanacetum cinerariifolium]